MREMCVAGHVGCSRELKCCCTGYFVKLVWHLRVLSKALTFHSPTSGFKKEHLSF